MVNLRYSSFALFPFNVAMPSRLERGGRASQARAAVCTLPALGIRRKRGSKAGKTVCHPTDLAGLGVQAAVGPASLRNRGRTGDGVSRELAIGGLRFVSVSPVSSGT